MNKTLTLSHLTFESLQHAQGLAALDQLFLEALREAHPHWHLQLLHYRQHAPLVPKTAISELLIHCAIFLEGFIETFFHIEEAAAMAKAQTLSHNPISAFNQYFIQRRAKKEKTPHASTSFAALEQWLEGERLALPLQTNDRELSIALLGMHYLTAPETYATAIERLVQWCVYALYSPEGQVATQGWTLVRLPKPIVYDHLIPAESVLHPNGMMALSLTDAALREREGFNLTDARMSAREVQHEVNYCIYCHDHAGDLCAKGFPVKKGETAFKQNPLGALLTGCPLEEKISEMHYLKQKGHTIASLAMIMVDNPLCPATGHRICNDCMKACIYQKQEPVDIPQIETRVLTDVLSLPWGVEIYDLLTCWNPLRSTQWVMKPYNGLKVLIAGMGPAGFTLAHHLLLEGFAVVGCDGLKIEPLPDHLIHRPIYRYADLEEQLSERMMMGFGGVAEYGITARWDKNFLKLIYLTLMRRPYFQVFGCVRLGGTITVEDAWAMGFDHFAIAVGAGLPVALNIPHSLAPGMRQANDFLMALHLGNAAKANSLTNLHIRLPAVIIGGGLTAIDTATEVQAYYIAQVEKISKRYHLLVQHYGEEAIIGTLDSAAREILTEYLQHAACIAKERQRAERMQTAPNFIRLIREWGGVSIVYRRTLQHSKAYQLNHEELKKALEEGLYYFENLEPRAVTLDPHGMVSALTCAHQATGVIQTLPARAILVATGTRPNTAYEFEHQGTFNRKKMQYQHYELKETVLQEKTGIAHCKIPDFGPFTSYQQADHRVSLIGDTHPVFHGSVVKAIASGMRTYPKIMALFQDRLHHQVDDKMYQHFAETIAEQFRAEVLSVTRCTQTIIELTVRAPLAAKHFLPGHFYRLQNFETFAQTIQDTKLQMEPLALTVAECNKVQGTLTFIVHEETVSAKLCARFKPGEPIALMGPTGVRAHLPSTPETILVIGDPSSFAFIRSYGPALKEHGSRVWYLCQYPTSEALYCYAALEAATDQLILQKTTQAAAIQKLPTLFSPELLATVDRIFVVGNTALLRAFQSYRQTLFQPYLLNNPKVYGSVYGNMQCMLKGVCAQCLQWQIDPHTGQRTKAVFACSWQNQPLELIDIDHALERTLQNHLMEHLNQKWLAHLEGTLNGNCAF